MKLNIKAATPEPDPIKGKRSCARSNQGHWFCF